MLDPGTKQELFEYGVRSIAVEPEWTSVSRPEASPFFCVCVEVCVCAHFVYFIGFDIFSADTQQNLRPTGDWG